MASPFVGGPERQVLGLARHLPPPWRTTFLSFAERGQARPFLEEADRAGFAAIALRHNAPRALLCIAEVAAELRARKADVLCCSGYKPDLIGWRAARRAGIPVVGIAHGWTAATWRVRVYEALDRVAMRWMDAVVCVSEAQAAKARRARIWEPLGRTPSPVRGLGVRPKLLGAWPEARRAVRHGSPEPKKKQAGGWPARRVATRGRATCGAGCSAPAPGLP